MSENISIKPREYLSLLQEFRRMAERDGVIKCHDSKSKSLSSFYFNDLKNDVEIQLQDCRLRRFDCSIWEDQLKFFTDNKITLNEFLQLKGYDISVVIDSKKLFGEDSDLFLRDFFPKIKSLFSTPDSLKDFANRLMALDPTLRWPLIFYMTRKPEVQLNVAGLMKDFKRKERALLALCRLLPNKNVSKIDTPRGGKLFIYNYTYLFKYFFKRDRMPNTSELYSLIQVLKDKELLDCRLGFVRFVFNQGQGDLSMHALTRLKKEYISIRRSELNDDWIDGQTKIILFTDNENRLAFENEMIKNILSYYGAVKRNFLGDRLKGGKSREKILNLIRRTKGKVLLAYSGHGSEDGFSLTNGSVRINLKEFGDALIARGNLDEVKIIFASCNSFNFVMNLRRYLKENGINKQPKIFAFANQDSIGINYSYRSLFIDFTKGEKWHRSILIDYVSGDIWTGLKRYYSRMRFGISVPTKTGKLRTSDLLGAASEHSVRSNDNYATISLLHFYKNKWRTVYLK